MEHNKVINDDSDYTTVMAKIDGLMAKGSNNVSKEELEEIRQLALAAQQYEQQKYIVEAPKTLTGMIEMKMYEMRLKQKSLAKKLKISDAKLSLILNGKQKPDVDFLKAVYTELKVDADFILQHL
ncbi:transcriptional regulator [Mucilaginibacter gotjawali]|uniref:HTH-type transcriptional regulator/antitoxin HigA n=2 Tax=Mucilaginibacter gotjawali TaxID=1550579 RepID=A0A839SGV9_9SPHI|nr:transcriptional regulator [Mucilaginibacter gotjawali]MBB3056533.1 HTH-type transcriptional regulator/antitoxin HigA [Mucilaginibacter gotjawali]BAU52766.1 Helix-turn-helix domain protein [Mucilaginibacter gotjawali]